MHVKVAELVGGSPNSWRDAVNAAVGEATQTLGNITGVEVINLTADVENGEIKEFKANVKVAYLG
ncbi:MAG: dodecin family protein [Bacillota bacterium]